MCSLPWIRDCPWATLTGRLPLAKQYPLYVRNPHIVIAGPLPAEEVGRQALNSVALRPGRLEGEWRGEAVDRSGPGAGSARGQKCVSGRYFHLIAASNYTHLRVCITGRGVPSTRRGEGEAFTSREERGLASKAERLSHCYTPPPPPRRSSRPAGRRRKDVYAVLHPASQAAVFEAHPRRACTSGWTWRPGSAT